MRIEATVQEIRALLRLAELDAHAQEWTPETHRRRRGASRSGIPTALLDRYQTLLDAGRCPVITTIEQGTCSGCHLRLPTMVELQARRSPAVHTCPHCRRMVYAPELLTPEDSRQTGSGEVFGSRKRPRRDRLTPPRAGQVGDTGRD
jgi:predicted  nucleic acid-binding Zn-ribbon protein